MPRTIRFLSLALGLAVWALLVAACVPATPAAPLEAATPTQAAELWYDPADVGEPWYNICTDAPPSYGGTVTSNQASPVVPASGAKNQYLWSQLLDLDVDGETLHPDVATSWSVSDDGLVYTFHLRDDVRFHDGALLTANDVKWTMETYLHPDSAMPQGRLFTLDVIAGADAFIARAADEVTGIKVVDDYTVEITLAHPQSNFLNKVRGVNIFPKHVYEKIAYQELTVPGPTVAQPVGSGPFKMGEFVPEQYYILEAFDDYYAGRPYLDRIIFRYGLTGVTAMAALEAGEIQIAGDITPDNYERLKANPDVALVGGPLGGGMTIWPNLELEPWQNNRVRQAIAMAVDRQAIIDAYYGDQAQFLPTYLVGPEANPALEAIPYDPEQATQLLNDAGWDWDYTVRFVSYYQSDFDKRVQSAMQQYWQDIGLKVEIQYLDVTTWIQRVLVDHEFDLSYGCCGWVDPAAMSEAGCTKFYPGGMNIPHYCNEELDELVKQATSEADPIKRQELFYRAQEIFHTDLAYIPMFWPLRFHAISAQLCGYQNHQISEPWTEMYPNLWYLAGD